MRRAPPPALLRELPFSWERPPLPPFWERPSWLPCEPLFGLRVSLQPCWLSSPWPSAYVELRQFSCALPHSGGALPASSWLLRLRGDGQAPAWARRVSRRRESRRELVGVFQSL